MAKEHVDKRIKKLLKNFPKKQNFKKHSTLFKKYVKTKKGKEYSKAGAFVGVGAGVGLIEGGAVGVAVAGTAFGVPLVIAGATVGLAGYGLYKASEAVLKETKNEKKTDKERPA